MAPTIRLAVSADAAALLDIYAPVVRSTAISFEDEPPSSKELAKRVERTLESFPWLVCENESKIHGYAYATKHRSRAAYRWWVETSVYVDPEVRRSGVGQGLYLSLFEVLKLQGFVVALAGITLPNPPSVHLHEAVGFEPLAVYHQVGFKLGAWRDVGWWQRPLAPPPTSPSSPLPLASAAQSPDWSKSLQTGLASLHI